MTPKKQCKEGKQARYCVTINSRRGDAFVYSKLQYVNSYAREVKIGRADQGGGSQRSPALTHHRSLPMQTNTPYEAVTPSGHQKYTVGTILKPVGETFALVDAVTTQTLPRTRFWEDATSAHNISASARYRRNEPLRMTSRLFSRKETLQ